MHHYQHHIGDYRRDTSHLSLLEHGVYRQLLDMYYLNEQSIPRETQVVIRRLSARTQDEVNAVEIVLKEFFIDTPDGWVHKRCDMEIASYQSKADANRSNGKLGGRPRKTQSVNDGLENETQNNLNHKPLTINHINTLVSNDVADCPKNEILNLYKTHLPMLTQVKVWNANRAALLKTRWREDKSRQSLEWWARFFAYIAKSDFLTGKASSWQADLPWILKAENFAKIIDGNYENKS